MAARAASGACCEEALAACAASGVVCPPGTAHGPRHAPFVAWRVFRTSLWRCWKKVPLFQAAGTTYHPRDIAPIVTTRFELRTERMAKCLSLSLGRGQGEGG
jgi:hypothetical protein